MTSIDLIECPQCGGLMHKVRDEMGVTNCCYSCGYFYDFSFKSNDSYEYVLDEDGNLQYEKIEMIGFGAFGVALENDQITSFSFVGPEYLKLPEFIDELEIDEIKKLDLMKEHGEYLNDKSSRELSTTLRDYEDHNSDSRIKELIKNAFYPEKYINYKIKIAMKDLKNGFMFENEKEKLNVSKCYLTSWDFENEKVKVIYGELPEMYRKYTEDDFYPY